MSEPPFFSVAICTYNRYDRLPLSIASVLQQAFSPDLFELWIIDNSPASPQRAAFKKQYGSLPRVHYVEVDTPGLSHARNLAVQKANAPWVAFLDDDAIAAPEWLASYHALLSSAGEDVGALGGRIDPYFEAPRPSWLADELTLFLSVGHLANAVVEYPPNLSPIGANMVLRRDLVLQSGGFDPSLGRNGATPNSLLSGEESAVFIAMAQSGHKILYAPDARVVHFIPAERLTRAWFRRRFAWQSVSDVAHAKIPPDILAQMRMQIAAYLAILPPDQIPSMGLFWDTEDPVFFAQQLRVTRYLTQIMLSEGAF